MSIRDACLAANEHYASSFSKGDLPTAPAKRAVVITCIDARLMPDQFLGLGMGDAHYIRNAGGLVTDDALRSLIISHHLLGTEEFFVINHTACGMTLFEDEQLRRKLTDLTGHDTSGMVFGAFKDIEANVREQVEKIRSSPFISSQATVHGLVYQVETGRLRQVV
jgi:carbonic anhydrase